MDGVASVPPTAAHTKQYVFVDEYNRHKRLKVMRACDGCRKRKIKCDGALQNGPWPCGACTRLKLKCAPPTLDPDEDQDGLSATSGQGVFSAQPISFSNNNHVPPLLQSPNGLPVPSTVPEWAANVAAPPVLTPPSLAQPSSTGTHYYGQAPPHLNGRYPSDEYFSSSNGGASQFRPAPNLFRTQTETSGSSGGDPQEVDATVKELSEHMGDLSIDVTSAAPYIANEKRSLAETPAVDESDVTLPASVGTDSTIRIPPEMMPCEERALEYFGYYFNYVHPYVPVLNRQAFYEQWRSARHTISPLLLEGLFACVARYLEEPIELRTWLALASRHEEGFKDVPRLSTIQAMILLTKAREFVPIRGYYYRSWMAVKYMTSMAFDVGLHEHFDQHRSGKPCRYANTDCTIRTRIWQVLFQLESTIGAPQGRTDFAVELGTVEFDVPAVANNMDSFEYQTSRRYMYMTQTFRLIKITNNTWRRTRRMKPDWALDPAFIQHNDYLQAWPSSLPSDMQVNYPDDGSPPWIGNDHFKAYVHIYYHLVIVMHYRPQLQALLQNRDQAFRGHIEICLNAAIKMCRLQEALIRDFGLHGLTFMLRGVGFTIYCVLTCAMLHLAAVTSPDPDLHGKARIYFTRHMRVLEQCIISATPEIRTQINNLREAFSADTSKPFELKASLGVRSPVAESQSTPPGMHSMQQHAVLSQSAGWQHLQDDVSSRTISPASEYSQPFDPAHGQNIPAHPTGPYSSAGYQMAPQVSYATNAVHQVTSAPQTGYALEPVISNEQQPVWDPSGIFQQWNSAFGGAQPQPQPSPQNVQAPDPRMAMTSAAGLPQNPSPTSHPSTYTSQPLPPNGTSAVLPEQTLPAMPTVTPVMWQDAFTTAFVSGHGHKRYRQEDAGYYDQYAKRRG
ncbi:hypothetical protein LTR78_004370 [Recurvomyces mirabilis]|uniref:Zn(2)-C6 fungal-type domain-containing protein n=1 Tax=Recurvomyces mirabilis TaxID=574656 RepID=A0AAE1C2I7_9PEZI|nr:hypothetical protein LTR78_004370 [Recurvomyces mirabilis]KAK5155964.1 hypothetical protein LTS14_005530 [Recurvomyces mirabilis]